MAGYRELLAVEWDANAVETFKFNFPGVPVYHGDIKRLGSWPDAFAFAGSKKDKQERIGNSVPPLFMRAIALHVRKEILHV
jgi:site-specific DNA-cytosine methylase